MKRRTLKPTKRELAINILKALYLTKEIDETKEVWDKRIKKHLKKKKSQLEEQNERAVKIINDKLL